jgi:hypothetical protein
MLAVAAWGDGDSDRRAVKNPARDVADENPAKQTVAARADDNQVSFLLDSDTMQRAGRGDVRDCSGGKSRIANVSNDRRDDLQCLFSEQLLVPAVRPATRAFVVWKRGHKNHAHTGILRSKCLRQRDRIPAVLKIFYSDYDFLEHWVFLSLEFGQHRSYAR